MRDAAPELQSIMIEYNRSHSVEKYYVERSMSYSDPVRRAARLLYLNRTCWNGLYRVNRRGEFNVPVGTKTCVIWDTEDFCSYAERLKRASIICQDFESTIDLCGPGDFLFVDPPYTVKHNMNGFIKYNEKLFSWDDQRRLASALRRAGSRGAAILVTNADHESVRDLYNKEFEYRPVSRHSVLAGSSRYRGKTTEALFLMNITDSIAVS